MTFTGTWRIGNAQTGGTRWPLPRETARSEDAGSNPAVPTLIPHRPSARLLLVHSASRLSQGRVGENNMRPDQALVLLRKWGESERPRRVTTAILPTEAQGGGPCKLRRGNACPASLGQADLMEWGNAKPSVCTRSRSTRTAATRRLPCEAGTLSRWPVFCMSELTRSNTVSRHEGSNPSSVTQSSLVRFDRPAKNEGTTANDGREGRTHEAQLNMRPAIAGGDTFLPVLARRPELSAMLLSRANSGSEGSVRLRAAQLRNALGFLRLADTFALGGVVNLCAEVHARSKGRALSAQAGSDRPECISLSAWESILKSLPGRPGWHVSLAGSKPAALTLSPTRLTASPFIGTTFRATVGDPAGMTLRWQCAGVGFNLQAGSVTGITKNRGETTACR